VYILFGLKNTENGKETVASLNIYMNYNETVQLREGRKLRLSINNDKKSRPTAIRDVTPCSLGNLYWLFVSILLSYPGAISKESNQHASILRVQEQVKQTTGKKQAEQAVCSCERSVNLYNTKRRHIPKQYSSYSSP
jgi:hypothetical protein